MIETEKMILELYTALKNLEAQSSWKLWEEDELRVTARKALRKTEKKLGYKIISVGDVDAFSQCRPGGI
jgi:ribonuclease D